MSKFKTIIVAIFVFLTGCTLKAPVAHVTQRGLEEFLSAVKDGDYEGAAYYVSDAASEQYQNIIVGKNPSNIKVLYYEDKGDIITYTVAAERDEADGSRERVEYEITFKPVGVGGVSGWKIVNLEDFYG